MMRAALMIAAALLVTPAAAQVTEVRSHWRMRCVWERRGGRSPAMIRDWAQAVANPILARSGASKQFRTRCCW